MSSGPEPHVFEPMNSFYPDECGYVLGSHPTLHHCHATAIDAVHIRTKPYLRDRRAGDPCDYGDCQENKFLLRVNGKGGPGIFLCRIHNVPSICSQHQIPDPECRLCAVSF